MNELMASRVLDDILNHENYYIDFGNSKILEIEKYLVNSKEILEQSQQNIENTFDDIVNIFNVWKLEFKKHLEKATNTRTSVVFSEKQLLEDDIINFKKILLYGRIKMKTCSQDDKESVALEILHSVLPVLDNLNKDISYHPVSFVNNKEFFSEHLCTNVKHQIGYIQLEDIDLNSFKLEENGPLIVGSYAEFLVSFHNEYKGKNISKYFSWDVFKENKKVDAIGLLKEKYFQLKFFISEGVNYEVNFYIFNQHIDGSPYSFKPQDLILSEDNSKPANTVIMNGIKAESISPSGATLTDIKSENEDDPLADGNGLAPVNFIPATFHTELPNVDAKEPVNVAFPVLEPNPPPPPPRAKLVDRRIRIGKSNISLRKPFSKNLKGEENSAKETNNNDLEEFKPKFTSTHGANTMAEKLGEVTSNISILTEKTLQPGGTTLLLNEVITQVSNMSTFGNDKGEASDVNKIKTEDDHHTFRRGEDDHHTFRRGEDDHHTFRRSEDDHHTFRRGEDDHHTFRRGEDDHHTFRRGEDDHHTFRRGEDDHHTFRRGEDDHHTFRRGEDDHHTFRRGEDDHHTFRRGEDDHHTYRRIEDDHHTFRRGVPRESPFGIKKEDNGELFNEVNKFNLVAQCQLCFKGNGRVGLSNPIGIAQLLSEEIVVADTFNNRLLLFDALAQFIKEIDIRGNSQQSHLVQPSAIVVLPDGRFAVRDNRSLVLFSQDFQYLSTLGVGVLRRPFGIAYDGDGNLVTIDSGHGVDLLIVRIDASSGKVHSRIQVKDINDRDCRKSKPRFIACKPPSTLLVVDLGLHCVYIINMDSGKLIKRFGGRGSGNGQFFDPAGIVVDGDGFIIVADSRNHRLQMFTPSGDFMRVLEVDRPLDRPSGLFLTPDGSLFLLNYWENSFVKYKLRVKDEEYDSAM